MKSNKRSVKMVKKISDKDKALIILKEAEKELELCTKAANDLYSKINDLNNAFQSTSRMLKRSLNEEELGKNVHSDCEYYNQETDTCYNFLMGKYSGLAFEVSRYDKCIEDII